MWYRIQLSPNEAKKEFEIQDEFIRCWEKGRAPANAAMFSGKQGDDGKALYLSPAAARLAPGLLMAYHAEQCPRPDADCEGLLVGHDGVRIQDIEP
jgi:hypothetical protein